jgi:hypothetical protein
MFREMLTDAPFAPAIVEYNAFKPPHVFTEATWNRESVQEIEEKGKDASPSGKFCALRGSKNSH